MKRFLLAATALAVVHSSYAATAPTVLTPAPVAPLAQATKSLPVTIAAGSGVLLRLPQAAATVMSADPGIARVQPASPDSLFLMGVAAGNTTVVATNETGAAIVQYDVTVNPGRVAMPTGGPGLNATGAQAAIAQSVQGASGVQVKAAGSGQLLLNGTVPTAAAAQQAEAIARGYVGEKGTVVNNLTVLGSIQVNVRVRIAEISRSVTRQLGFNWQALGSGNGWRFGLRTGAAVSGAVNPLIPLGLTA